MRRRRKKLGISVTIASGREFKTYALCFCSSVWKLFLINLFFLPRSYVDFITHSSNCRSWTRHAMQILLKWRISVFVMLVLKKQIRFTGSLLLPDSEGTFWPQLTKSYDKYGKIRKEKKKKTFLCNACQLWNYNEGEIWCFFLFFLFCLRNIQTMADHSCIKKRLGRLFLFYFSLLCCGSSLYVLCFICSWLPFFPSWMRLLEAFFRGAGYDNIKKVIS